MTVRVHVLCEGETEEAFTKKVLAPGLFERGVFLTPRLFGRQGGDVRWPRIQRDILASLKQDPGAYCTTFIDYYGRATDFPGEDAARRERSAELRRGCIEAGMLAEVERALGDGRRFIPYIQMYEFEGLLFSEPERLALVLELSSSTELAARLREIRDSFPTPEDINDDRATAPSKRLKAACPAFSKVFHGIFAAEEITLAGIRAQCRFFDAWVARLEALPQLTTDQEHQR